MGEEMDPKPIFTDLMGLVKEELSPDNKLFTALGIFNSTLLSKTYKFDVELVAQAEQLPAGVHPRYGERRASIIHDKRDTRSLEMAFTMISAEVYPSDFQGISRPGTGNKQELTLDEVTADRVLAMRQKLLLTHEAAMARSLLTNKIVVEADEAGLPTTVLDMETITGRSQSQATIDLSQDKLKEIEEVVRLAKGEMGGLVSFLRGFYLLASPAVFEAIRYDKVLREVMFFGNADKAGISKDLIFPASVLPAFETFSLGGFATRVIRVDDTDLVPANQAFLIPVMAPFCCGAQGVYNKVYGPCSRNISLAATHGPAREFLYMESEVDHRRLSLESNYCFFNSMPNIVVRIEAENAPVVDGGE